MLTAEEISGLMYDLFFTAIQIGGPVLLLSMAVGVLVSVLQAATQIHEQSLTFVPKLVVIGAVLLITGGSMLTRLQDLMRYVFELMAAG